MSVIRSNYDGREPIPSGAERKVCPQCGRAFFSWVEAAKKRSGAVGDKELCPWCLHVVSDELPKGIESHTVCEVDEAAAEAAAAEEAAEVL